MATDWAPVIQTGIGAAAALGGGVIGAWLQSRTQERIEQRRLQGEERADRQQRREGAASLLAEVSALLRDLQTEKAVAQRLQAGSAHELPDALEALHARSQGASEQLILMAIREPSPEVRRLARELERAMSNSVAVASMMRIGRAIEADSEGMGRLNLSGEESYAQALQLLSELVEAI